MLWFGSLIAIGIWKLLSGLLADVLYDAQTIEFSKIILGPETTFLKFLDGLINAHPLQVINRLGDIYQRLGEYKMLGYGAEVDQIHRALIEFIEEYRKDRTKDKRHAIEKWRNEIKPQLEGIKNGIETAQR